MHRSVITVMTMRTSSICYVYVYPGKLAYRVWREGLKHAWREALT